MEYLDPWTSRAFAVSDHQISHVYVRDSADIPRVRDLIAGLDGVDEVLDQAGKEKYGLDHERAGELVAVAEPDAWFTYYYWLDDDRAPDFAKLVEIHRKPGYDPAELFMTEQGHRRQGAPAQEDGLPVRDVGRPPRPQAGQRQPRPPPDSPEDGPVLIGPWDGESYHATEVKDLLLKELRRCVTDGPCERSC